VATLATTDEARTLEIRASLESEGVIAVTVTSDTTDGVQALGVGFIAEEQERFVGFGERGNAVDQRGWSIENFVAEGPYQDNEYILVSQLIPPWGLRWRADTTYFPIPWLLSSRGYGVLLDNDDLSYHRVESDAQGAWSMEVESTQMRFRVFGGPTPAEALGRFTAALGTQPDDYAPWFFGPWLQTDADERIDAMRSADVPTSVTATYLHYRRAHTRSKCSRYGGAYLLQSDDLRRV
jgi:alpha-glucosidase (family GH31 glycosyl hydrolase)